MLKEYLTFLNESIITFPKREWEDIKKQLKNNDIISTVRNSCYKNKIVFKVGQIYNTEWGVTIKIIKVKHFNDPKKIPTWNKMDKVMQNSIMYGIKMCGVDNLQWVHLKKI